MNKRMLTVGMLATLAGCGSVRPDNLGLDNGQLAACPPTPNCVSSTAADEEHTIAPFKVDSAKGHDWNKLVDVVKAQSGAQIVEQTDQYLYAEFTSSIMRYIDDVEFYYQPEAELIQVRSASRVGHHDLWANSKRVEAIRKAWQQ